MKQFGLLILIFISFTASAATAPAWQKDFETYLDQVIADYGVPGIAVEVVDQNGVVFQVTRGYRDVANKKPVTVHTLYAIGSTTKAFTGVLLAQLYDEGKLDFDAPVVNYWPDFKVMDPTTTATLNLRDLLGHWTGVGRHDGVWYYRTDIDQAKLLSLLSALPISAAPHEKFIYNNMMYVAAGHVAEVISGQRWEELLATKIFSPLGMAESNTSTIETLKSADYSLPYNLDAAKNPVAVPHNDITLVNPAGGIYSNLNDMAKWLQFHLNDGVANGQVVLSAAALAETYLPYSVINETDSLGMNWGKYGMGWAISSRDGVVTLTHDGGIDGFMSNVSILPEKKMGIVVLMNNAGVVPQWIAQRLWDHIRSQPLQDYVKAGVDAVALKEQQDKIDFADPAVIKPAVNLNSYTGKFCHDAYGGFMVTSPGADRLHIKARIFDVDLFPASETKFFMAQVYDASKYLEFKSVGGAVDEIEWGLEPAPGAPVVFKRCD